MSSVLEQLIEMGFTQAKAEKAIKSSGNKGLEEAMEWIVENDSGDENDGPNGNGEAEKKSLTPRSYICEDCQKSLKSDEEVQLHSARTGHINYAESSDPVKPLTEEERKQQMEKLQELLRIKKAQREEQEKQEELERERQRRQQGKTLISAKEKFEEDEMRRLVEQKRREKEEDRAYREKLKADIAREREEKRARELGIFPTTVPLSSSNPTPVPTSVPKTNSTVCRLQIRLPSGQPIKAEFGANEPLSSVTLYISQNWPDSTACIDPESIQLMTSFPRRDFTPEDMNKSLLDLDLCPSSVVIVRQGTSSI
ncbi:unnamed protein product [Trichobilharzia szidati]|nr:unnamed protein product [Trichobilharzia szidati]